jgi:hypothetical protein
VNQRLPSGPAAISSGALWAVMPALYLVIVGAAAPVADASSTIPSDTAINQRRPDPTPRSFLTYELTGKLSNLSLPFS